MNPQEALAPLKAAGIRLIANGDKLRYSSPSSPPGALTDELRALIREHKPPLLKLLSPPPEVRPGLPPSLTRDGTCFACCRARWWLSRFNQLVCGECHPPASPVLVARWFGEEEAPAQEARH